MNLQSNDFELFGVAQQFAQDRARWTRAGKTCSAKPTPTGLPRRAPAAQRLAMQWSVRINEAYQRLKDPLKRAAYLCELHGAPIKAENNTAMPPAFLMQQMEWREDLEEAESIEDLENRTGVQDWPGASSYCKIEQAAGPAARLLRGRVPAGQRPYVH